MTKLALVIIICLLFLVGCTQSTKTNVPSNGGELKNWIEDKRGGVDIIRGDTEIRFSGVATTQYWTAESNLYKQAPLQQFSADVQLVNTNATGADAGIVLTDGVNFLGMSKHWGDAGIGWQSDCLVAENGVLVESLKKPPTSYFTNFKIKLTQNGYEAYCNETLLHSGSMTFTTGTIARLKGSTRAIGDHLNASFKNVQIK